MTTAKKYYVEEEQINVEFDDYSLYAEGNTLDELLDSAMIAKYYQNGDMGQWGPLDDCGGSLWDAGEKEILRCMKIVDDAEHAKQFEVLRVS